MGYSPWGREELETTERLDFHFHFHALEKEMATDSSVLACKSQGQGSLVGCRLWGRTESDTTEATQQQQLASVGLTLSKPAKLLPKAPGFSFRPTLLLLLLSRFSCVRLCATP